MNAAQCTEYGYIQFLVATLFAYICVETARVLVVDGSMLDKPYVRESASPSAPSSAWSGISSAPVSSEWEAKAILRNGADSPGKYPVVAGNKLPPVQREMGARPRYSGGILGRCSRPGHY